MVRRVLLATGLATTATALALLIAPIRAEGVSGNAIAPRYGPFGAFAYKPLPEHPTVNDLHSLGVRVPQDAVAERRRQAAAIAAGGLTLLLAALLTRPRRSY